MGNTKIMPATQQIFFSGLRRSSSGIFHEQRTKLLPDGEKVFNHGPPPVKPGVDYVNQGEEDQMEIYGYQRSSLYTFVSWVCIVGTAGLLRLVFHWYPHWMLYATHKECKLEKAEKILAIEHYQNKHLNYHVKEVFVLSTDDMDNLNQMNTGGQEQDGHIWSEQMIEEMKAACNGKLSIPVGNGEYQNVTGVRIFQCKKLKYLWNEDACEFHRLRGLDDHVSTATLHQYKGLNFVEQCQRRLVYGSNEILVEVKGVMKLLFLEILNPFYMFQIYSICLWFGYKYYYYATAIIIMSLWGIISTIVQTRQNQKNLQSTIHSSDVVTVWQGGNKYETIATEQLVPGDVIVIPSHGCIMHCDAALLKGNCIVNESMLTGESVPVTKTPIPNKTDITFNIKEHARHTLFCGTQVIQTRFYGNEKVTAVVLRTGFLTSKGNLVRSIMYPPPVDFRFEQDSYRFVGVLAAIAAIGFVYTVVSKFFRGINGSIIALESLDLITIVVPPALPAAMTVGRYYAQNRLKLKNIYCISPRAINVAGSLDCVCFDKTGTLTEDGLDMWGVVPVKEQEFQVPVKAVETLPKESLLIGMATCHSLTVINGKISGDPLDLKMFESTGWVLEEPNVEDTAKFDIITPTVVKPQRPDVVQSAENIEVEPHFEVGIVRQFPFSSGLQRMSVITRTLGAPHFELYCKGSPEMIASLCRSETVPSNFDKTLQEYTQEGYRVIAVGFRTLTKVSYAKVQRLTREDIERDLEFLGLLVMENRLKLQTIGALQVLKDAAIRTVMVTGDNMLTAISVARDCNMVASNEKVIIINAEPECNGKPATLFFTYAESTRSGNSSLAKNNSVVSDLTTLSGGEDSLTKLTDITISVEDDFKYHFAVSGKAFAVLRDSFPSMMPRIAVRGTVFARMSPDQKQQLVQILQDMDYCVGMCGDGANDCGALKAAHAGISLSEAESSVASPFTSKEANISCVPELIREGRAALVTSFGIFKYMAAYSLTQFVTVIILYSIDSNLTDAQFLYIDLFLITLFAFFFGKTGAYEGNLVKTVPLASLISVAPVVSIVLHILLVIVFQAAVFFLVQQQPWFIKFVPAADDDEHRGCHQNYVLFSVSAFQYILLAVIFSKGAPYRRSILTNRGLLISLLLMTAFTIYVVVWPCSWLISQFSLVVPPSVIFRVSLLGFGAVNLVLSFLLEWLVVDRMMMRRKITGKKHFATERELRCAPHWPPISQAVPEVVPPHCQALPPVSPTMELTVDLVAPNKHINGRIPELALSAGCLLVRATGIDAIPTSTPNGQYLPSHKKNGGRGETYRPLVLLNGYVGQRGNGIVETDSLELQSPSSS